MTTGPAKRLTTGNATLDEALGGGLAPGSLVLVEGEEGAGAAEFALTMLRHVALAKGSGTTPRFLSALRSGPRVAREIAELFPRDADAARIEVQHVDATHPDGRDVLPLLDLPPGSLAVIESASALARMDPHRGLLPTLRAVGDKAAAADIVVLLLSAPDTMTPDVEASMAEASDGVLSFQWIESGNARRRLLRVKKMRGLAPILDGEQIPIFEVGLHRGRGFSISKVKSLI